MLFKKIYIVFENDGFCEKCCIKYNIFKIPAAMEASVMYLATLGNY